MLTMNLGKDLLEQLNALSKDSSPDDKEATKTSAVGVQNVLGDLQDRRRALEELWNKQRRRVEQYIALSELDQEINQVSTLFCSVQNLPNISDPLDNVKCCIHVFVILKLVLAEFTICCSYRIYGL